MKNLRIDYHKTVSTDSGVHTLPMNMNFCVKEEGGFLVLRFTEESFGDIVQIAKNQGLRISVTEGE